MEAIEINIESRAIAGSVANKKLRSTGKIPGVVYSQGKAPINIVANSIHFHNTLKGVPLTHLFKFVSDNKDLNGKVALVKDLQINPVRQEIIHFDFYEIHKGQKVTIVVPVVLTGEPAAVKSRDGILAQSLFEITVECLPTAIPEEIALDVSALELGTSLFIKDLKVPEGVLIKDSEKLNIVTLTAVSAEEEKTVSDANASAKPAADTKAPATKAAPAAKAPAAKK